MLETLLLGVCLLEVHHRPDHDNYKLRDYVCSDANMVHLPFKECGDVKDFLAFLDDTNLPFPMITRGKLEEFYELCCDEA